MVSAQGFPVGRERVVRQRRELARVRAEAQIQSQHELESWPAGGGRPVQADLCADP